MDDVDLVYEVEDGYCGGSRPQRTIIDRWDIEEWARALREGSIGEWDIEMAVEDIALEDMHNNIGVSVNNFDCILQAVKDFELEDD